MKTEHQVAQVQLSLSWFKVGHVGHITHVSTKYLACVGAQTSKTQILRPLAHVGAT